MNAIVSTKGQVVIPQPIRKSLGIRPGDEVRVRSTGTQVVLEKVVTASARPKLKLVKGRMPVIQMPKGAEPLTPAMVREIAQL